ncbi:MAG: D-glycero-D-manno-heptose 1,7-bisphosphate phosphatase [Halieaceae bacterium]|jgi:D-glycero-D-manno-heptose 1,7-bisphosphate phosphatase
MAPKLIILDRDGVINVDSPDYIKSAHEWVPIEGSIAAIGRLHRAGYRIVIATNQSGIGRGLFDRDILEGMHNKLREMVDKEGGVIDGIYYCPHLPEDGCLCRKPATGLLDAISRDYSTSLSGVPMVGDSLKDLEVALATGCRPILVQTGKGADTESKLNKLSSQWRQLTVLPNLSAVANLLIASNGVHFK